MLLFPKEIAQKPGLLELVGVQPAPALMTSCAMGSKACSMKKTIEITNSAQSWVIL